MWLGSRVTMAASEWGREVSVRPCVVTWDTWPPLAASIWVTEVTTAPEWPPGLCSASEPPSMPLPNRFAGQPYLLLLRCLSMSQRREKAWAEKLIENKVEGKCAEYLSAARTLVSAPVYMPVVLETARVFEQFATLVTAVAPAPTAGVKSLAHTVWGKIGMLENIRCWKINQRVQWHRQKYEQPRSFQSIFLQKALSWSPVKY